MRNGVANNTPGHSTCWINMHRLPGKPGNGICASAKTFLCRGTGTGLRNAEARLQQSRLRVTPHSLICTRPLSFLLAGLTDKAL